MICSTIYIYNIVYDVRYLLHLFIICSPSQLLCLLEPELSPGFNRGGPQDGSLGQRFLEAVHRAHTILATYLAQLVLAVSR